MQRTPISEDTQYKAISFKSPSLIQDNNKIKLFEAGEFQTSLRFIDFGLIDGISPIDLQDAKDKLLVLIGTISEGGGDFVPITGTTVGNPITGNIEIRSTNSNEKALILSKEGTVGITENPKFSFGRIVNGGINEPKLRILFIDDEAYTSEITCFEVEPSGTAASVRSVIGSHYEGFLEGEEKPLFRIASFLKDGNKSTRMEFGSGGNNETDIFLERWASWAFALVMGGSPKIIFYPDSILRQPGVVDAFQQTPIGQVVATPNPDVKKLFYREGKGLVELGGDGIEKPLVNNNSGNFIPLSGTTVGNPITGDLEWKYDEIQRILIKNYNGEEDPTITLIGNSTTLSQLYTSLLFFQNEFGNNQLISGEEGFTITSSVSNSKGLSGSQDFTPNITELDYTQKIYVDSIISNEDLSRAKRKDDTLYGILDQYTGEEITLTKISEIPIGNAIDGVIYFQLDDEIFKRNYSNYINVKWFGAKGDSITDDTLPIKFALANMPNQGATLFFPSGIYLIPNGGLTSDKQILFQGEGRSEYEFTPVYDVNRKGSVISTPSSINDLFISTGQGTSFENIAFECTASNATAGAGIILQKAGSFSMDKVSVRGFYDNLRIFDATRWSISDSNFYFPTHYGILIENDPLEVGYPDTGDNSISGVSIVINKPNVTGIKYKSSGGLKLVNTKINPSNSERVDICFDLETTGNTDQLMITNCSLEGFVGRGIKLSAPTGKVFDSVFINGNQIRSQTSTVTAVEIQGNNEAIRNVIFSNNLVKKNYNDLELEPALLIDGISQLNMSGNQIIGYINKKTVTNTGYVYDIDAEGMDYFGQVGVANSLPLRGYRGFSNQGISLGTDLSGVLIQTDLDFVTTTIVNLIITGNTVMANNSPIETTIQLLNFETGSILCASILNKGDGINNAKAFHIEGKLWFWIEPTNNYSTFNFEIQTNRKIVKILSSSVGVVPGTATDIITFVNYKVAKSNADGTFDFPNGIVLKSPDNTRWKSSISNVGVLTWTAI